MFRSVTRYARHPLGKEIHLSRDLRSAARLHGRSWGGARCQNDRVPHIEVLLLIAESDPDAQRRF